MTIKLSDSDERLLLRGGAASVRLMNVSLNANRWPTRNLDRIRDKNVVANGRERGSVFGPKIEEQIANAIAAEHPELEHYAGGKSGYDFSFAINSKRIIKPEVKTAGWDQTVGGIKFLGTSYDDKTNADIFILFGHRIATGKNGDKVAQWGLWYTTAGYREMTKSHNLHIEKCIYALSTIGKRGKPKKVVGFAEMPFDASEKKYIKTLRGSLDTKNGLVVFNLQ